MTAQEIVDENFKGLDELIEDKELVVFYKGVIRECMVEYAEQAIDKALEFAYNQNSSDPIVTANELLLMKNEL